MKRILAGSSKLRPPAYTGGSQLQKPEVGLVDPGNIWDSKLPEVLQFALLLTNHPLQPSPLSMSTGDSHNPWFLAHSSSPRLSVDSVGRFLLLGSRLAHLSIPWFPEPRRLGKSQLRCLLQPRGPVTSSCSQTQQTLRPLNGPNALGWLLQFQALTCAPRQLPGPYVFQSQVPLWTQTAYGLLPTKAPTHTVSQLLWTGGVQLTWLPLPKIPC